MKTFAAVVFLILYSGISIAQKGKAEIDFYLMAPYEWRRNGGNERVLDFPYDKKLKSQMFKYQEPVGTQQHHWPPRKRPGRGRCPTRQTQTASPI